jgi:hypothetical protein
MVSYHRRDDTEQKRRDFVPKFMELNDEVLFGVFGNVRVSPSATGA